METLTDLGEIVAEQVQRISFSQAEAWEKVLRLHIKPKPAWIPVDVWRRLVNLVITQSEQRIRGG